MFKGSIVAIITPMHADGEVDETSLRALLQKQIASGTNGVVVNGSTGESATLTAAERERLICIALEECSGKIPVIAGTGTNSTATTIEATKKAMQLGVAACLVVTPYYNRPTQAGLFEHYKAIAENCQIPVILYNVPGRTGCDLLPETAARLSNLKNIVGIKEATGDISRVQKLRASCKPGFLLFTGNDDNVLQFIREGGDGNISAVANVVPKEMATLCKLLLNGSTAAADALDNALRDLYKILFIETNPIAIKWAVKQLGFIEEGIRLPLTILSLEHRETLQTILNKALAMAAELMLEEANV